MKDKKKFKVYKLIESTHFMIIEAETDEEAEEIAEALIDKNDKWTKIKDTNQEILIGESDEAEDDNF